MTTYIENLKELSSLILKSDYDCPPSEVGTPLHFLCKVANAYKAVINCDYGEAARRVRDVLNGIERKMLTATRTPVPHKFNNGFDDMWNDEKNRLVAAKKIENKRHTIAGGGEEFTRRWSVSYERVDILPEQAIRDCSPLPSPSTTPTYQPSVDYCSKNVTNTFGGLTPLRVPREPSPFSYDYMPPTPAATFTTTTAADPFTKNVRAKRLRTPSINKKRSPSIELKRKRTPSVERGRSVTYHDDHVDNNNNNNIKKLKYNKQICLPKKNDMYTDDDSSDTDESEDVVQDKFRRHTSVESNVESSDDNDENVEAHSSSSSNITNNKKTKTNQRPSSNRSSPSGKLPSRSKLKAIVLLNENDSYTCKYGGIAYLRNKLKNCGKKIVACMVEKESDNTTDIKRLWENTRDYLVRKCRNVSQVNVRTIVCKNENEKILVPKMFVKIVSKLDFVLTSL